MRLSHLLSLSPLLAATVVNAAQHAYNERLSLTQLANHHLHADFTFNASTPLSAYESHHYQYFPRSLAQILQSAHTAELHLRFALGRWDDELWGSRPRDGRREGGTGVEIWAWLEGDDAEERWSALVNSLSGLFCASLNFIDGTKTTSPVLTFEPEGTLRHGGRLMHALLPREVICTENLTPFLKLLPCKGKSGVSSLLDGHKLFDSSWQSMSIDVRTVCPAGDECLLEIEQGVSMALSIPRSLRDRDNMIPKPVPVEEINCDDQKWNFHDSCYPRAFDGEMAWSLSQIFGRTIQGKCELDTGNAATVVLNTPRERTVDAGAAQVEILDDSRSFTLAVGTVLDLNATQQHLSTSHTVTEPAVHVTRQLTGHGQERGGMRSTIHNPHPYEQKIVFFESLPWFLRPFMHTLTTHGAIVEQMYYTPLKDRKRGTHLELLLTIPAHSTAVLEYQVEKAILRYTEYPPDANRGFDIGAAIIRVLASSQQREQYLRTIPLLLPLPTPDFSMPYNVIILTSTVIALGFGSIFNLLIRKFVLASEVPPSPLVERIQALIKKLRKPVKATPVKPDTNDTAKIETKDDTAVRRRKVP